MDYRAFEIVIFRYFEIFDPLLKSFLKPVNRLSACAHKENKVWVKILRVYAIARFRALDLSPVFMLKVLAT